METPPKPDARPKADPAIYPTLRANAMQIRLPDVAAGDAHAVLMDWRVANGMATVMAAADGTASLYLSSGGGYIGGGQGHASIREAALRAVQVATKLLPLFVATEAIDFPASGEVFFFVTTNGGPRRAVAKEEKLRAGTDPLGALGGAMQQIITEYRMKYPRQ
jgi:hypothetical protein